MTNPSLMMRIGVGKTVGLVVGLIGFFLLPHLFSEVSLMTRWAFLFWYITMGAFIGVFGVFTWHPILKLPMPWWFRSAWVGAWMNFVLTLFIFGAMQSYMLELFGADGMLKSPFWFVLEGALIGLLIGFLATRFGGEGKETIGQ